jgi:hypothetical protein
MDKHNLTPFLLKVKNDKVVYSNLLNVINKRGLGGLQLQTGGGLIDELRSKVDKNYVKDIDFTKPGGISDEDKHYIKTLSSKQKEILKKKIEEQKRRFARKLSDELRQPVRIVTGKELEGIKLSLRDKQTYDNMMEMYKTLKSERSIPEIKVISSKEFQELENMFKNFELNEDVSLVGGGIISDKIMIKTLSKLNNDEIKMLCNLDRNVKSWCKKHGY